MTHTQDTREGVQWIHSSGVESHTHLWLSGVSCAASSPHTTVDPSRVVVPLSTVITTEDPSLSLTLSVCVSLSLTHTHFLSVCTCPSA